MDDQINQEVNAKDTATEATQTPEVPTKSTNPSLDCPDCKGLGLVNEQRCPNCQGTGKALANNQAFPDGTQVIRSEGTFNIVNGVEVKQI